MLTIGLIIGLFVAFLVYLDDLQEPPAAAVESGGDQATANARDVTGEPGKKGGKSGKHEPNFEFYSILPDLEVVVPHAGKEESGNGQSGGSGESGSAGGNATGASGKGPYYLQAGSFQKTSQADRMKARIALLGLDVDIQSVRINGAEWHRVRVGPYDNADTLRSAQKRLSDNDIDYLVLRAKSADTKSSQ